MSIFCYKLYPVPFAAVSWCPGQKLFFNARDQTCVRLGHASGKESASVGDIEMQIQSLGREDPLEEGVATYSILTWRLPWTGAHLAPLSMGLQSQT